MKDKIVEICKKALLKQLHPMIYQANTYPVEAVSKATILSLDKLVESDIAHLYSAGEGVSDEEIEDMAYQNNWGLSEDFAITFQEGFTDGAKWMRSKLTRPTVSEGEDGCKNYEADDTTGMNCKWCGDPKWVHDEVRLSPTQQPSEGEIQKFYDKYSKVYHYDQNDPKQTQLTNRRITGNCVAIHGKAGALNIVFDEIRKMYYEQILTLRQEGESAEFQIIMNRID